MEHLFQLQQQIQKLRHEVNNIAQMTSELQQFEQNNAMELQKLHQHEVNATQQLQRIQQNCHQLNNDLNQLNSTTHQITQTMGSNMGQHYSHPMGTSPSGYSQQFGSFSNQTTPGWSGGYNQQHSANIGHMGWGSSTPGQSIASTNTPYQQHLNSGAWAGQQQTAMPQSFSGQQNFAQGYNFPSQSYAENQQISRQAQQALDQRVNRATQGLGNQIHAYGRNF